MVETAGRRPITTTTDYLNGYQYENRVLQFFPTAEGYVKSTAPVRRGDNRYSYVYNYTDHLGNVRLSYENNNNVLTVLEEKNYYPFGIYPKTSFSFISLWDSKLINFKVSNRYSLG